MKRRLKYKRVVGVISLLSIMVVIIVFMATQVKHDYEYTGKVMTYDASYQQDDKVYSFLLKSFTKDKIKYVCLNDIYNIMKILDHNVRAYIDYQAHTMTYELSDKKYVFDYGHDKIVYNNKCIEFENKDEHIYVSHKNIYISVFQTEKLLLNNEKKLKFDNKNAIIL